MNDATSQTETPQTDETETEAEVEALLIDPREFGPADIAGNPPESIADPPAPGGSDLDAGADPEPGDEDNHGDPEAEPTS
jgi:hypothetical protein